MTKVTSIDELTIASKVNQRLFDILSDVSVGRVKTASMILGELGLEVSDKLVRTWREKTYTDRTGLPRAVPVGNPERTVVPVGFKHQGYPIKSWFDEPEKKTVGHELPVISADKPKLTVVMTGDPNKGATTHWNTTPKAVSNKPRTIVIMPDVQAPLHDMTLVAKFTDFLEDFEPTELAQVGDFTDSTEISRWVRGKKPEFAGDLQSGLDATKRILENIRNAFDGRIRIVRSNHDDRLELYIQNCAPGLGSLEALSIENLAGFNEYEVEFVRDAVVELTPGADKPWIMAHGDEGALSPIAGRTAFGLAKNKFGANVICGHTHRAGMTSESTGFNGKIRDVRYGLEVGHFMDLSKADYLKKKGVAANWQQAFGILYIHGDKVYPQLIQVNDGNFSVEGQLY